MKPSVPPNPQTDSWDKRVSVVQAAFEEIEKSLSVLEQARTPGGISDE